ncbi:hypothetical protein U0N67_003955 [Vibrio parahaemolyticus]|uniref:hypothetical protein n=1 Tax=Vibrio diabolicus subgroup TaxID=2315253 RepID=UPI0026596663|nr:hypothetical protein [Vibrio antiquarius]EIO3707134.1 hypothetical protein [Vibrio parahaemolyticus]ELA9412270.1 hypothetical protein [Vibrio parahaemolyticus]ELA9439460.1 hypothetical protein [Vibrio parahaemolyticus]ELZ7200081.1 hypothetical protein [Vibrio parahaemolyticus]MCR9582241.1 hypothetical protein [Vibrio antiquarius]
MAKHLTDKDINDIVELLDEWPVDSKLTWDLLVASVKDSFNLTTTRQTIQKQARIKAAFKEVKDITSGRARGIKKRASVPSLKVAQERLDTKDRKIERLERENRQLLEQFVRWVYNASLYGLTPEQLNEPLPKKSK